MAKKAPKLTPHQRKKIDMLKAKQKFRNEQAKKYGRKK
jgi:hypothetical protein